MRLFYQLVSLRQVDYLDDLCRVYAREASKRRSCSSTSGNGNDQQSSPNGTSFMKFYQIYLSRRPDEIFENASNAGDVSSPSLVTVLQPKCPLECYLRLVFTYSGHDLNYLFDHSLPLVNVILQANKKVIMDSFKISYNIFKEMCL